jgi:hypothetical protein
MFAPLLALLLAAPEPATDAAITVTATRLTPAEAEARATSFVKAVLPPPSYGQYGRWTVPVCVKVTGITDPAATRVTDRVRAVAATAGMAVGGPRCRANLNIIFSEDASRTTGVILRRRPGLVARLPAAAKTRLISEPLPVRWWYGEEVGDGSGVGAGAAGSATALATNAQGAALAATLPVGPDAVATNSYSSSLIDTHLSVSITQATAIVDVTLATGKPLDAVADHVAMVTLAPTRLPPDPTGVPSILGLFSSGTDTISSWDRAWLSALGTINLNRRSDRQRGQLIARMKDQLTGSDRD